jgi:hypothetical protein
MAWRTKKTKQGFVFEEFGWYDIEKAKRRLKPRLEGGKFASNNQTVDEDKRTDDESSYIADANQYIKRLNEYGSKKAIEIKKEVYTLVEKVELENINFSKLHRFFKEKSSSINDAFIHEEEANQERRLDLRNELNTFRLANKLSKREAYYPKSYILHFAWIFVFIFVEALINAYFFGEASSLGLLGGVLIGFITSFFNVTLSTIAGYVLRYKNHVSWFKKILGLLTFTLLLVAIFVLHLFIAHYREILSSNPHVEIWSVLEPMLKQPFALHDMETIILISLGLLVTLFSILKGMNLDDKYPGYGAVYRRWREKEDQFLSSKKQARKLMRELYSVSLRKSDEMVATLSASKKSLDNLHSDMSAFINTYTGYHLRTIEGARTLISSYRNGARFVYGERRSFEYSDRLLVGEGGLSKLNNKILLESQKLLEDTLEKVDGHMNEFYKNQRLFENELDELKDKYLSNESIEKILYQVKKNRELEL